LQAVLRPGATELELAQAFEALARDAKPVVESMVRELTWLAMRHWFEAEAISAAERAAGTLPGGRAVTVAFADVVGFTRLGEALPPEELGDVAGQLANLTRDVVAEPVHFVKTIGDAVMLVSPDAEKLLNNVLDLMEAAGAVHFPRLRAGIASGLAVTRAGDWYGSPVNLASRVTGVAPRLAMCPASHGHSASLVICAASAARFGCFAPAARLWSRTAEASERHVSQRVWGRYLNRYARRHNPASSRYG
jgi:adenylate cyclase